MKFLLLLLLSSFFVASNAHERTTIADNADDVHPLLVGHTVPDKPVWTIDAKPVTLAHLAKEKPLVLIVYRGGWCPYCNHQLNELKSIEGQLTELGFKLVAVSPELPDTLKAMQTERQLGYELLSDFRLEFSRAMGLAFRVEDRITGLIKERYNAKLQRFAGEKKSNLPVPAVFVIDTKGVIQFSYVNPDYSVRLSPELLLKAAEVSLNNKAKN